MNRKIAISGLAILASLTLVGFGVYAAFVSTASATSNTFSTANPNLEISTDNSTYSSSIAGFTGTGIIPAGPAIDKTFYLKNQDPAATMALTGRFTITGGSGGTFNDHLSITLTCSSGTVGPFSINALHGGGPQALGTLAAGAVDTCTMSTSLPSGDNTDKGKSVIFDVAFDGTVGS